MEDHQDVSYSYILISNTFQTTYSLLMGDQQDSHCTFTLDHLLPINRILGGYKLYSYFKFPLNHLLPINGRAVGLVLLSRILFQIYIRSLTCYELKSRK